MLRGGPCRTPNFPVSRHPSPAPPACRCIVLHAATHVVQPDTHRQQRHRSACQVCWLAAAGITRERLESFDRAIKVEPEDYPDKRGALIKDFRNYLGILKAVHSGADLNASAQAAGDHLPGAVKGYLGYVQTHQGDHIILPLIENAVEARTELQSALAGNR